MDSKRRLRLSVALVILLALAAAAGTWLLRAVPVTLVTVGEADIARRVAGPGTVQARVPVLLSARQAGVLTRLAADVGDRVRQSQLLATLDDRELVARRGAVAGQQEALARNTEAARTAVVRAEAEFELARSRQHRDAELLARGFVSPAGIETSSTAMKAAQAALDGSRATLAARQADARTLAHEATYADTLLSHTRLLAPLDAIVVARLAEVGSTVAPGTPILRLVDPATLWVATRIDESVVGAVVAGQPAHIVLRSGGELAGRVARIARQADAATREIEVYVGFDQPPERFAIDQQAEVRIDVGSERSLAVPLSALLRDGTGRQGVLMVVDGRTRFVPVLTASADGDRVPVRQGLKAGDAVVAPVAGLKAGQRVTLQPR
ncbi:MAG: efflux RND transporter periplasmic adaptor subunit [Rubrivivax sp.]|nr:efflux RND transporter periplasmic adaptor subunit [Rubrivivax sp.]